jgi:hypothetical protein
MEQNTWSDIELPRNVKNDVQNDLTFFCFDNCIVNLRTRDLDRHEAACLDICTEKYAAFFIRAGRIFGEQQVLRDSLKPQNTKSSS